MISLVDTRVPGAVEERVQAIYRGLFPKGDQAFVAQAFEWARECFAGNYADYQPIDAVYHDFEHTLQGTLCLMQLLKGRHSAHAAPVLTQRMFELSLLAILFHDTGYLKKRDDLEGTGAKYTPIHVGRSVLFAGEFLAEKGFAPSERLAVQNMISCTGVNADLRSIPFQSDLERTLGFALATADLLGQMAAEDYVDKLPILYEEFAEAARFGVANSSRLSTFTSAEDLMRKTPAFWNGYVLPRIRDDFGKLYLFLNDPQPDGPNVYVQRIEERIGQLQRQFADA